MAIVVNEEVLNLSQPSSEIEKWVKKRISEIAEGKKLVVIKDARPRHYSSDRKPDPYPPNLFYMEAKRYDKGVSERWKYCSNPTIKTDKNGNQKPLRGDRAVVGFGELILNPQKQADQIFFFTEIMDVGNFNLVIENREELSKIDNEKRMLRAEAEYNILTKLSDEELYMLAAVYNLDTEEESIDILKSNILVAVTKEEESKTGKGYKEFNRLVEEGGDEVKVKAIVQKAISKGVVEFKNFRWYWTGSDTIICVVAPVKQSKKEDVLSEYMMGSTKDYELLKTAITGTIDEFISKTKNVEFYESIGNFLKLKQIVSEDFKVDIPNTAKKTDVMAIVKDKLSAAV